MRLWLPGCIAIALVCFVIFMRNEMAVDRNQVRAAWAGIDV